jgi:hypothetical protein
LKLVLVRRLGVLADPGNPAAVGVDEADIGGVGFAKGLMGVARPELKMPGLICPNPGDMPGDTPPDGLMGI